MGHVFIAGVGFLRQFATLNTILKIAGGKKLHRFLVISITLGRGLGEARGGVRSLGQGLRCRQECNGNTD